MEVNLSSVITNLLSSDHKCIYCMRAGLVQDWVKTSRILALVENHNLHGLLICVSAKEHVTNCSDITIENALPINEHFKCEIDSTGFDSIVGTDSFVKITYKGKKLLFELPYHTLTWNFIAEINKAIDASQRRTVPSSYGWLEKYNPNEVSHVKQTERLSIFDNHFIVMSDQPKYDIQKSVTNPFAAQSATPTAKFYDTKAVQNNNLTDIFGQIPFGTETGVVNHGKSSFYSDLESPDNLPRDSIAVGATPLAPRESVIRAKMDSYEDQYTDLKTFRIFIGTWNVNGQSPAGSLGEYWLSCDPKPPDIYAIGFQELDLSKEAFLFNDTPKEEEWLNECARSLHPLAKYKKVRLVRLIGMMLVVFAKKELMQHISHIAAETVGTGLLGKMGNKGGVAIRFELYNSSLCFVNSHLAAHVEEYERRNQDYNEICSRLLFNQFRPQKCIKDHNHVYWFGDLNYRLMNLSTEQVKGLLDSNAYTTLLQNDQLKVQHGLKKVFAGYIEGEIRYMPTYKFDPGTDNWDSSEKNRPPAWCDRILWTIDSPTKQLMYRSHQKLLISDHKPVSALFNASIKVIDDKKYRKIYEDVMKKLDKLENEFLPQVMVDKMEVDFGTVTFKEKLDNSLTIANTGQVQVMFEFINKPNESSCCKNWLRINPYSAAIKPGETKDITLTVCVDMNSVSKLNSGDDTIYDILVLHLDRGKDLFITVSGSYQPSCFGCAIDTLIRLKDPIRIIPIEKLQMLERRKYSDEFTQCWDIPKELWIIVDQLYKYGMLREDLFQQSGPMSDFQQIRDTLDNGWPEKLPGSAHSVAEALLIFLGSLSEPVIPYNFYIRSLECSNNFILCKQVVNEIPQTHRHVFYYLIAFLRELLRHSNSNKLDSKTLASIFSGILLRSPPEDKLDNETKRLQQITIKSEANSKAVMHKKAAFVFHFLVNDFDI